MLRLAPIVAAPAAPPLRTIVIGRFGCSPEKMGPSDSAPSSTRIISRFSYVCMPMSCTARRAYELRLQVSTSTDTRGVDEEAAVPVEGEGSAVKDDEIDASSPAALAHAPQALGNSAAMSARAARASIAVTSRNSSNSCSRHVRPSPASASHAVASWCSQPQASGHSSMTSTRAAVCAAARETPSG